jgi:hypothetical protein
MLGAQKNQFKKGKNVLFTFLGEHCLVQTIEETDFKTPDPIALFLRHCRRVRRLRTIAPQRIEVMKQVLSDAGIVRRNMKRYDRRWNLGLSTHRTA